MYVPKYQSLSTSENPSQIRRLVKQSIAISSCRVCCAVLAVLVPAWCGEGPTGLQKTERLGRTLSQRLHRLSKVLHVQAAQHTRLVSVREARIISLARHTAILPVPR
jgi:hypothetical protein